MPDAVLNHLGHCVADLSRAVTFYCAAFGFEEKHRMTVPDEPTARLLQVGSPGLEAVYLVKGTSVLELLCFHRAGSPAPRRRSLNEPGLTHLSFSVGDLGRAKETVVALGGTVEEASDVGMAVFVRDPDGQLIELIDAAYRAPVTPS